MTVFLHNDSEVPSLAKTEQKKIFTQIFKNVSGGGR